MGSGYSTQTSLDQGHRGSKRMSYRPRASGASMVHSSGEVPPLFPTPLDPPHRSHFILGIFHLKYMFKLPHCPVAALNGASFSSYGMSRQKGSFLIPGAGRCRVRPAPLAFPARAHPANSGLRSSYEIQRLTPLFPKEDTPLKRNTRVNFKSVWQGMKSIKRWDPASPLQLSPRSIAAPIKPPRDQIKSLEKTVLMESPISCPFPSVRAFLWLQIR